MENKKIICLIFSISLILWVSSCATSKKEKSLDSASEQFLSKVRYIITPEEREVFLKLAQSEREKFIEEFWKRRDPTPQTPENEFRVQYFRRINEANRLFNERGTQGWLTDRGRVWIILGRPDSRDVYPYGYDIYPNPVEVWYYRLERIFFVDRFWSGQYQLEQMSSERIASLTQVPDSQSFQGSRAMDFDVGLKKIEEGKALVTVSLPYSQIWFKAQKDRFETTIEVILEIENSAKEKIWSFEQSYPFSLSLEELKENFEKNFVIEVQAEIRGESPFILKVAVENKVENKRYEKKLKFEL
jgi:GWxTD domain-containing protein